jgi:hypothetical protein
VPEFGARTCSRGVSEVFRSSTLRILRSEAGGNQVFYVRTNGMSCRGGMTWWLALLLDEKSEDDSALRTVNSCGCRRSKGSLARGKYSEHSIGLAVEM